MRFRGFLHFFCWTHHSGDIFGVHGNGNSSGEWGKCLRTFDLKVETTGKVIADRLFQRRIVLLNSNGIRGNMPSDMQVTLKQLRLNAEEAE